MGQFYVRETFFRPPERERQQSALPAPIYNTFQLLLARSETGSLFLPIRRMQYQAVIERKEIIFVDNHGGYAHQDGEGGRLIRIAWRPQPASKRTSLSEPVPCEIVFYFPDLKETQWRLISEIQPLLQRAIEGQRDRSLSDVERRVIPFRPPTD